MPLKEPWAARLRAPRQRPSGGRRGRLLARLAPWANGLEHLLGDEDAFAARGFGGVSHWAMRSMISSGMETRTVLTRPMASTSKTAAASRWIPSGGVKGGKVQSGG